MTFLQRFLRGPSDGKVDKLRELPALAPLHDEDLRRVAAAGELATIPSGTVLITEGQPARWCYLLLSGSVESSAGGAAGLCAGAAIGDAEVLARSAAPATVTAATDLVVLAMGSREFTSLLDSCPGFSHAVHVSLSKRVTEAWRPAPPRPSPVLQLVRGA
jgi:CRP-like cAMP-binding protein